MSESFNGVRSVSDMDEWFATLVWFNRQSSAEFVYHFNARNMCLHTERTIKVFITGIFSRFLLEI